MSTIPATPRSGVPRTELITIGTAAVATPNGFDFVDGGVGNDSIVRNDGGSWLLEGYVLGGSVIVANATVGANNGTYTILAVTATTIEVATASLTASTDDNTATFGNGLGRRVDVRDPETGQRGPTLWVRVKNIGAENLEVYFTEEAYDGGSHYVLLATDEILEGPFELSPPTPSATSIVNSGSGAIWLVAATTSTSVELTVSFR